MKKIVILTWHPDNSQILSTGGFQRVFEILKRRPKNVHITIIDKFPSIYNFKDKSIIIDTYKIPNFIKEITRFNFLIGKSIEKIFVSCVLFFKILFKYKTSIVYVPFSELLQLSLPAILAKIFTKQKVIFTILNVNIYYPEYILSPIIHKYATKIITISKSLQTDLKKYKINANYLNPVGIDLKNYKAFENLHKKYDGIFIGRHTKEKGIFEAVKICAEINKTQKFKLITIGDIPQNNIDKINKLINGLHQEKNIIIRGTVNENEKFKLLNESRVCIFCSYQEGWGIVPQEA